MGLFFGSAVLFIDSCCYPSFPLFSSLCVGVTWVFLAVRPFLLPLVLGFSFCAVWPVETWCYGRGRAWTSKVGDPGQGLWDTRKFWPQETIINQTSPNGLHLNPETKPTPHPQRPASSSTGCLMPNIQQNRNTKLPQNRHWAKPCKPIGTPKHSIGWHCPSERQDPDPSTRIQAQVPQNQKTY